MTIRGLIFDYGRVLGRFDKHIPAAKLAGHSPHSAREILELLVGSDIETDFETGNISEAEFGQRVIERIQAKDLKAEQVVTIWGDMASPNSAIEPFIEQLIARKIPIAVLSNTNSAHWPFNMQLPVMQKLAAYGAPFILSHEVRAMKPDRKMFDAALAALSIKAGEALYIDDIPAYVEAAKVVGLQAEQYNCETDPPERLREIFKKYGLTD